MEGKKLKVLLITAHFYWAEGNIAKSLVKVLPEIDFYFFCIHELKYRFQEFDQLVKQVDVVHWLFNVGYLHEQYKSYYRAIETPQIATIHHVCDSEIFKIEEASHAHMIHVVAEEWLHFVESQTATPVFMAPLGVSVKRFSDLKIQTYSGKELFKIGMLGSYPGKFNRKRIDLALDVLTDLHADGVSFELVVQGPGWERFESALKEREIIYKRLDLKDSESAITFFQEIHVLLSVSDVEGGPLPVLEALACGIPVVATKVGIAEMVLKKGGGILCDKGDKGALVRALKRMKDDREWYLDCSLKGKTEVIEFDWQSIRSTYEKMYQKARLHTELIHSAKSPTLPYLGNAGEQRQRELLFDALKESVQLMRDGMVWKGISLGLKPIWSVDIPWHRKTKWLKQTVRLLVTQTNK